MKYLRLLLIFLLAACHSERRIARPAAKKILDDSTARVSSLSEPAVKERAYYITPAGKKVLLVKIKAEDNPPAPPPPPPPAPMRAVEDAPMVMAAAAPAGGAGANDPFTGRIRVTPKTTFSTKRAEKFRTIPALFRKLPSAETMKNLGIGRSEERVEQENRNVIIEKAYLYTITVEDDNDLHLLIGNTPVYDSAKSRVFNAEISGVPPDGTAAEKEFMRELRRKALGAMGDIPLCGRNDYLQAHRRISIRGSLFFDSHHASKPARCREVEGESAWEIHPVKDISFHDD